MSVEAKTRAVLVRTLGGLLHCSFFPWPKTRRFGFLSVLGVLLFMRFLACFCGRLLGFLRGFCVFLWSFSAVWESAKLGTHSIALPIMETDVMVSETL